MVAYKEFNYELGNGNTKTAVITEQMINDEDVAKERAKSEFLKHGYSRRWVSLKTYRTDLKINDTINMRGLPYLVKSVVMDVDSKKIVSRVRAVRYE